MLESTTNRTHVVWSIENNCLDDNLIAFMRDEGVEAVRLVSESGDMETSLTFAKKLKSELRSVGSYVPIIVDMIDRVRAAITGLAFGVEIGFGDMVTFVPAGGDGDFEIETKEWDRLFRQDVAVFMGSGQLVLEPTEIGQDSVTLRVIQGGLVQPGMELHCPGTDEAPVFTDVTREEITRVCQGEVDCVVVPGFSGASDLQKMKSAFEEEAGGDPPWIFLKIDSAETFRNLNELLPHCHGVLISRVELAMSLDPARIPMITKEIIQLCNHHARIAWVASEILGSMRYNATPTRAEVSDIANAALDGADGVVLSEDLPYGKFARRGLELARKTIHDIEKHLSAGSTNWMKTTPEINDEHAAVTFTAWRTAQRNNARAIVCLTKFGNTALLLSSFRTNIPIIAVTLSEAVNRRLSLVRGVTGIVLELAPGIDDVLPIINERIVRDTWLEAGDKIVFVAVSLSSVGEHASNLFTVQTLK